MMSSMKLEFSQPGNWVAQEGQSSLHSQLAKACGQMGFAGDLVLPGMLVGKALRSPYPHCRINQIDAHRALEMPGVHAVLTADDIPGENVIGKTVEDQQFLVSERARSVMDALAIVAAETDEIAQAALEAIYLDLTPLPAVFDPQDALGRAAIPLHKDSNLLLDFQIVYGDAEAAMSEAEVVIENAYYFPWIEHAFLETEAALAAPNNDGSLTIWLGCHNIYAERMQLARAFAWPDRRFRVILVPAGGSFGGKDDNIIGVWAALLAHRTGRPVRFIFDRRESIRGHSKRHSQRIQHRLGARSDGQLVAAQVNILFDTGAYAHWGASIMRFACLQATGPYRIRAAHIKGQVVYTNNITAGAMRGWGTPGVEFAMESQMDVLAEKLGFNPIQLRWINALKDGDETITGRPLPPGCRYRETLEAVARAEGISL